MSDRNLRKFLIIDFSKNISWTIWKCSRGFRTSRMMSIALVGSRRVLSQCSHDGVVIALEQIFENGSNTTKMTIFGDFHGFSWIFMKISKF